MPLCSQLFQCEEKSGGPVQRQKVCTKNPPTPTDWPLQAWGYRPRLAQHLASTRNCRIHSLLPPPCCGPYLRHGAQDGSQPYNPLFSERSSLRHNLNKPHPCSKPFQGSRWHCGKNPVLPLPASAPRYHPASPPLSPRDRLTGLLQRARLQPFLLSALCPFLFTRRTSLTTVEIRCSGYFQSELPQQHFTCFVITHLDFSLLPPPDTPECTLYEGRNLSLLTTASCLKPTTVPGTQCGPNCLLNE